MLRPLREKTWTDAPDPVVPIHQAAFPRHFREGLEYSSPARGGWNIVHTGMMIPESHQIFVCAAGCLRGVVLTAAENLTMDRFSAIEIREENVLNGDMEELMIGGVRDVLEKLPKRPKAILLFISCQHFFLAYDRELVFDTLRNEYPDIKFADCYMIPTLRKSGLTPDQKMRIQMYSMLENRKKNEKQINLMGSNLAPIKTCEVYEILEKEGFLVRSIQDCQTFAAYESLAEGVANIISEPLARMAGEELCHRLGQKDFYLPAVFRAEEIKAGYRALGQLLGFSPDEDFLEILEKTSEEAICRARKIVGNRKIALDYSFTFRILSFARFLLEHGFPVTEIYADAFFPEEEADFRWLQNHHPDIRLRPASTHQMRSRFEVDSDILAIGQKAAYFTGSRHFVNVAEGGGLMGFGGICEIMRLMEEAVITEKDAEEIIQKKGYGCESCL